MFLFLLGYDCLLEALFGWGDPLITFLVVLGLEPDSCKHQLVLYFVHLLDVVLVVLVVVGGLGSLKFCLVRLLTLPLSSLLQQHSCQCLAGCSAVFFLLNYLIIFLVVILMGGNRNRVQLMIVILKVGHSCCAR